MSWREGLGDVYHDVLSYGDFEWTLPNLYSDCSKSSPHVMSPWFSFEGQQWRLALLPGSRDLGLFLWRKHINCRVDPLHIEMGFDMSDLQELDFLRPHRTWETKPNVEGIGCWKFLPLTVFREKILYVSPNGKIKIFCKIKKLKSDDNSSDNTVPLSEELSVEENKENDLPVAKGQDRLLQDLEKLLREGQISDVILKVENCDFRAHKSILCARSPVFASMFQVDMVEKKNEVVPIPDCSSEAFKVFLRFLYTGSVQQTQENVDTISEQNVCGLYYAADKYAVDDLKEDCVEFMKNSLSVDTFCDVFALSLRHSESELQKVATRFFCGNVKKIIETVQWQKYIQENSLQANELHIKAYNA